LSILDKDHPQNLGMIGMHGTYAANMAAVHCDLLIGMGVRFDDRVTGIVNKFAPKAKIAHFDIDPSEINKIIKPRFRVLGDLAWSAPLFTQMVKKCQIDPWMEQVNQWKAEHPLKYNDDSDLLKPQFVIEAVNDCLSKDAIIVTDVGQHQMWTAQYGHFKGPRSFLTSGGLGTMGYGLPAAIGAALACPEKEIWLFTGDGSLMMNCQEIATAVELDLSIKVIILNNNGLGMVRQWQRLFYGNRYSGSQHQKPTDFIRLAQAFDAQGVKVLKKADLAQALADAKAAKSPFFLDVMVEEEEDVLPMVAPNAALDQMME
ncbi:MAG: thiamine pyrophosphate-dependent enzyme, partial [Clostridiales bacterium]